MNKQELIERIEGLKNIFWDKCEYVKIDFMIELVSKLDEPQKVTIPQFVADWIEVCKEHLTSSLYLAMTPSFLKANNQGIELTIWIKKNEETFARAWLDGYTVEEKRYTVKIKAVDQYLVSAKDENFLGFLSSKLRTYFTRKELEESGFGWVFDCPGMEVEEVER